MNSKTFETLDRPAHPVWDLAFTRLWQHVSGPVEGCVEQVGEQLDRRTLPRAALPRMLRPGDVAAVQGCLADVCEAEFDAEWACLGPQLLDGGCSTDLAPCDIEY